MDKEYFEDLLTDIRCATFHMNDEEAKPIIDEYLKEEPELLDYHTKEWYYKYC